MEKGISDSDSGRPAAVPGERPNIGIFGKRNTGKSTLFNLLLGQNVAVVSDLKGTTTDPVRKSMELDGVGAVTLIDTPGYDDDGDIGSLRVEQSVKSAASCDVALVIVEGREDALDRRWTEYLEGRGATVIIIRKEDIMQGESLRETGVFLRVRDSVFAKIRQALASKDSDGSPVTILGNLVSEGDIVVLVMPQDKAAPKGRLIMPQMQTVRELLDRGCMPLCVSPENLAGAFGSLSFKPRLVITDSQAFSSVRSAMEKAFARTSSDVRSGTDAVTVKANASVCGFSSEAAPAGMFAPEDMEVISDVIGGVPLTSFSILFSRYKGDIRIFKEGAAKIASLAPGSRVLIAEACAHRPLNEDIGRVKLPALLRRKVCEDLNIDVVAGSDWPSDLGGYDLIIHCGACMFNRRLVLSRIADARCSGVPITNYGLALSALMR